MIIDNTVFILGAGASVPYGYPTGKELRERICSVNDFSGRGNGFIDHYLTYFEERLEQTLLGEEDVIKETVYEQEKEETKDFRDTFLYSGNPSIDLFLKRNQEKFGPIGKKAIITEILMCEAESKFREEMERYNERYSIEREGEKYLTVKSKDNSKALQDWYSHLFYRMTEELIEKNDYRKFSDSDSNNVSFITFNYDRSLEHFLYDSLKHTFFEVYEEHEDRIRKQLLELNKRIIHVYGKVAKLDWEKTENNEISIPYKKIRIRSQLGKRYIETGFDINTLSSNIMLMHERKKMRKELNKAKKFISEADRIFFLGFGYAKENLNILGLPSKLKDGTEVYGLKDDVKIYGTALGATKKEIRDIRKKFNGAKGRVPISERVSIQDMDCLALLKGYL